VGDDSDVTQVHWKSLRKHKSGRKCVPQKMLRGQYRAFAGKDRGY
jgi:hypothetical protein